MKNIANYDAPKYKNNPLYLLVENGIYLYDNPPDATYSLVQRLFKRKESYGHKYRYGPMFTSELEPKCYVTSLSFEQESRLGEGSTPALISQFPMEDILDEFNVSVSDFYKDLNHKSQKECYQEFASTDIEDLKKLRSIIGKHVSEQPSKDDQESPSFVIE